MFLIANDRPMHIHKQSNHPPNIIKNLPASISRQISDISYDEEIFKNASPAYVDTLKSSGYTEGITYLDKQPTKKKRNRQRNVIWFNPPIQQQRDNKHRRYIPKTDQQTLPKEIQTEQDIQQEHGEDQLQLHAQHRKHHQSTQQTDLNERNRDRPNNLQLPKKGPMPHARKLPSHQHHL